MAFKLSIPSWINQDVVEKWIGKNGKPINDDQGDGNYCVMVRDLNGFRFLRFFPLDGVTSCSVDFDSTATDETIFNILMNKFGW